MCNGGAKINLIRVYRVLTHPIPLDRSLGSLETSQGPESVRARFGDGSPPGLIIDQSSPRFLPAFAPSKNLPACLRAIKGSLSGLRFPFTPRALSGWYVPSPDLGSPCALNGRNAEYSALLGSRLTRPVLKPDREEKGLGLTKAH